MKHVDTSVFVANSQDRIKPEAVDLGSLPPIEKPIKQEKKPSDDNSVRNSERTDFRSENRSVLSPSVLSSRRRTIRYSFEFFEDQILKLKNVKHRAEMNGVKVTLSDIAREALDQYLKDKDF
jgi:hypothetical protein